MTFEADQELKAGPQSRLFQTDIQSHPKDQDIGLNHENVDTDLSPCPSLQLDRLRDEENRDLPNEDQDRPNKLKDQDLNRLIEKV